MVGSKRRGYLQFGLRTILVVTTLTAFVCALLFAAPIVFGWLLLMFVSMAMPVALTVMIVYGRGYVRAFGIGGAFPGTSVLLYSYTVVVDGLSGLDDAVDARMWMAVYLAGLCVAVAMYGGVAVLTRWLVERWQRGDAETEPSVLAYESPFDTEDDDS